jgi:hypothetical protein
MDSYQAIYDAVRSRISNGDVGNAVSEAARQAFDISFTVDMLRQDFGNAAMAVQEAAWEHKRPSAVYHPTLTADGTAWCALLGDDLQSGVAGFGDTPAKAMVAFDLAFLNERTPAATRLARREAA